MWTWTFSRPHCSFQFSSKCKNLEVVFFYRLCCCTVASLWLFREISYFSFSSRPLAQSLFPRSLARRLPRSHSRQLASASATCTYTCTLSSQHIIFQLLCLKIKLCHWILDLGSVTHPGITKLFCKIFHVYQTSHDFWKRPFALLSNCH